MKITKILRNRSMLTQRMNFLRKAGLQYDGNRDIYAALGYNQAPGFQDYYERYTRQDVARRIIVKPPSTTWRREPVIRETGKPDETKWVKDFERMAKRLKLYAYLERVDRLAGIGQYGVLFIGTKADNGDLSAPLQKLTGPQDVLYLQPFMENQVEIKTTIEDMSDPRYGMPEIYEVTFSNYSGKSNQTKVHWSRIIHVAEEPDTDEIKGTPRLLPILNRLHDLEKVVGGSAESYWRIANKALHVNVKNDGNIEVNAADIEAEVEDYVHDLENFIFTENTDIKQLNATVADPKGPFDTIMTIIATTVDIPKRILMGNEAGELASTTDLESWFGRIRERQVTFAEPFILRPFVDRLISVGALEAVEYEVIWETLFEHGEDQRAEIASKYANAINAIATAFVSGSPVLSLEEIRKMVFGLETESEEKFDSQTFKEDIIQEVKTLMKQSPGVKYDSDED